MSLNLVTTPAPPAPLARVWAFVTRPLVLCLLATVSALYLYWRTAYPSVLPGDAGELQFAAWGFWLAHPTGYPLYLLLGGIWQHLLPFGDAAYRLNLFSAFWSGLAVGAAFLVFYQVTRARGAAMIAALTFAVSPLFWSQATRAEVYALNTFFIVLLALLGLRWRENPKRMYAFAFAFVLGLALAHHRMILLLAPAFAALFAEHFWEGRAQPKQFAQRALIYLVVAAIPLLVYLYIPLRAGATPYATLDLAPTAPIVIFENSPRGWLSVMLGSSFSSQVGIDAATLAALRELPNQALTQFNLIGALTALFGFGALLWRRKLALAAFTLYGFGAFVLFGSVYHIGDIADYYAPAYFFACVALAEGIAIIVQSLRAHPFTRNSTFPAIALLAFFALLPLQNLFGNFADQNHRTRNEVRVRWENWLKSDLPRKTILLSNDRDEMTPLYYLQWVENKRPDIVGVFSKIAPGDAYGNVVNLVGRVAPAERPIYAIKPIPALVMKYIVAENKNGLWKIHVTPLPTPVTPIDVTLGDALRVRGWTMIQGEGFPGETLTLALQYEPLKKLTRDYTFSLQLMDQSGRKVAQGNDHIPGEREFPSSRWHVGQVVQDTFEIVLDSNLPPGEYKLMLHAYDPTDGAEIGELTELGIFKIEE